MAGSLKNKLYVDSVPDRGTVGTHPRAEAKCIQHIAQLSIVSAIARRIEAEELRIPFFVNVEVCGEMVPAKRRGRRQRRKKELGWSRGIVGAWTSTRPGSIGAPDPGSDS